MASNSYALVTGTLVVNTIYGDSAYVTTNIAPSYTYCVNINGMVVSVGYTYNGSAFTANTFITGPRVAPTLTSVSPTLGINSGATVTTITGTGFVNDPFLWVTVGGKNATSVSASADGTTVTCTTPSGSNGAQSLVVVNPDIQKATGTFTYTSTAAPTVTSLSPNTGPSAGGTSVTITGTGFVNGATVTFNGFAASSVVWNSSSSITCNSPNCNTGIVATVVVTNPDTQIGTKTSAYTYTSSTDSFTGFLNPGSNTYTALSNITFLTINLYGTGGGGSCTNHGGGGAGGYSQSTKTITGGSTVAYTMGVAGAGNPTTNADGSAGTASTCNGMTVNGGNGGKFNNSTATGGTASGGTTNTTGGSSSGNTGGTCPGPAGSAGGAGNIGGLGATPGGGGGGGLVKPTDGADGGYSQVDFIY